MSFVKRSIEVTFTRAEGTFSESGGSSITLRGLRMSTKIVKAGGPTMSTANLQIYGMTLSLMNQLSTLGMQIQLVPRDTVTISAGDNKSGMAIVFVGNVTNAYSDFANAPDALFVVQAHVLSAAAAAPASPTSFRGSVDVATILSSLATQMGLSFENNGVSVQLSNPYFPGTFREQALAAVTAADISWNGGDDTKLAIWPKNGSRGGAVPLVSTATGMRGYPAYTALGILVSSLFNPNISFGSKIEVVSDLKPACGIWSVFSLEHDLDTNMPRGSWFSTIGAYNPKFPTPVV